MKRLRQETYEPRKRLKAGSLIEAVKRNDVKEVKQLLTNGANVHACDDYALRWASYDGHAEMVSLLLNAGANVHADDDDALRTASRNGHVEVVSLLLNAGADVHAYYDYALRCASYKGHVEMVSLLLKHNADVHIWDDCGLCWASSKGHFEVCYLILNAGADPQECSKEMLAKVKKYVCSHFKDIALPTCLKNNIICNFLVGY